MVEGSIRGRRLVAVAVLLAAALAASVAVTTSRPVRAAEARPVSPGGELGIATGCCVPKGTSLEAQIPQYAATGATWVRTGLHWTQHELEPAYFAWPRDGVVSGFRQHGLKILAVLSSTPSWAADPQCASAFGPKCPPVDAGTFARFAGAAAERYDGDGVGDAPGSPRIDAWEIWNEPNFHNFWKPAPDPVAYATLLRSAYRAIKSSDPTAVVVSGGLSPAGGGNAPVLFASAMYGAGAGGFFDALGFHPYSYPAMPTRVANWNAWQQMFQDFSSQESLRTVMTAHGDGHKQIWATEYGAPTHGDTNADGAAVCDADGVRQTTEDLCVTESRQAQMLHEAITQWRSFEWAGPLFWYSFQDLGSGHPSIEQNFGMYRTDGSAKEALTVFRDAAAPPPTPSPTTRRGLGRLLG